MKKVVGYIIFIAIIFFIPFIFPLIARFLIHIHMYEGIQEFKEYMSIFTNNNFLWFIILIIISIIILIADKEKIINWISERDIFAKFRDAEVNIKKTKPEMVDESDKKKNLTIHFNTNNSSDKNITSEVQEELKLKTKGKGKKRDEVQELQEENNNLRFYSAYNIINKKTKELLNVIYCDKSMRLQDFKDELIRSFKNRNKKNKNLTNAQKTEYANNKYETIKNGLQYLNIIEISDDNKVVTLTLYGKEFVEKYIEKEVGEDEN